MSNTINQSTNPNTDPLNINTATAIAFFAGIITLIIVVLVHGYWYDKEFGNPPAYPVVSTTE